MASAAIKADIENYFWRGFDDILLSEKQGF